MRIHEKNLYQLWGMASAGQIMWAGVAMYLFGALAVYRPQTDDEILQHDEIALLYSIAARHADAQDLCVMQAAKAHEIRIKKHVTH